MASWYITALLQSVLLVYWISNKVPGFVVWIISLVGYLISLFVSSYINIFDGYTFYAFLVYIRSITPLENSLFSGMIFVTLGKYLAENINNREFKISNLIIYKFIYIIIFLLFIESYLLRNICITNDCFISLIPLTFCICYGAIHHSINIDGNYIIFTYLRKCSILIYLIHPIIIYLLMNNGIERGVKMFLFSLILSLLLSIIIIICSKKIKILKYLY